MTRSMTRWTLAGCMALAALSAVAVFDVGSPTAQAAPSVSPFAGSWSGTWSAINVELVGTYDWTINWDADAVGTPPPAVTLNAATGVLTVPNPALS